MPEEKNAIDQYLAEVITLENRRQGLIRDLLKQREEAIRGFDAELAKLGHTPETPRRNHHRNKADAAGPKLTPRPQKAA